MTEEVIRDELGGIGPAMAVIDASKGGVRGRLDLGAILDGFVGLDDCDRELTDGMRVEVSGPKQRVVFILAHTGVPLDRAHASRCKVCQP